MSDVKVYYCSLSGVQIGPKTTPVVLASDYKALAARLMEAKRLLERAEGQVVNGMLQADIDAFLASREGQP